MKVMVMVKATADSEAGVMPAQELLEAMGNYNEELVKAGIMLSGEGLHPSSKGVRVRFSGKNRAVTDGPFAETNEIVAGFWLWQVKSMEEAVEWVKKCPNPMMADSEIEIRPVFEAEDFGEALTPELQAQEDRMREEIASYRLDPPRWEVGRERVLAGVKGHFTSQTRDRIPAQWCALEKLRPKLAVQGKDSFGVCWGGHDDGFDYMAAVEVKDATAPDEAETITLPAQRYAVFTHHGDVSTICKTCEAIFGKWLPNSGHQPAEAPFLERYTEQFNPQTLSGGIELWVPLKG